MGGGLGLVCLSTAVLIVLVYKLCDKMYVSQASRAIEISCQEQYTCAKDSHNSPLQQNTYETQETKLN
jgi:hypothetical protein